MKAMKSEKTSLNQDQKAYYLDHHGDPQKTFVSQVYETNGWISYGLFGVAGAKLEHQVFASKDELLASIVDKLNKLS
jgi:hypothetical protein